MHLEEIVSQSEKEDFAAGMARFLIGHFPMVANKLLPEGEDVDLKALVGWRLFQRSFL
jgi:hypothetical protein